MENTSYPLPFVVSGKLTNQLFIDLTTKKKH